MAMVSDVWVLGAYDAVDGQGGAESGATDLPKWCEKYPVKFAPPC